MTGVCLPCIVFSARRLERMCPTQERDVHFRLFPPLIVPTGILDPDDGASWQLIYSHPRSSGTQYAPADARVGGSRPQDKEHHGLPGRICMTVAAPSTLSVWTSPDIVTIVNSDSVLLGNPPGPDRRQAIAVRFQLPALFQPAAGYLLRHCGQSCSTRVRKTSTVSHTHCNRIASSLHGLRACPTSRFLIKHHLFQYSGRRTTE
ncbi:hypothetical protein F5B21DRAFT_417803 [Xylaria acuta]|nr:hypothetical protein F5B21DRAFT_417803 [Xylaria acuta]